MNNPNSKLFPWQRRLFKDIVHVDAPLVLEKSRRVGGTFAVSIAAVHYCLNTGLNCWFSSSDEKNGREFIRYVQQYAKVINSILGKPFIDLALCTTETVVLPNGSRINALSSNPTALRGKDGLIILDEFALHQDQESLMRAAQGCVIQKGKLVVLSTHDGGHTVFFDIAKRAKDGTNGWRHHKVTLADAVKEGYAKRFGKGKTDQEFVEDIRTSCLSPDAFGQEFMCEPLSMSTLIKPEDYDKLTLWPVPDTLDNNHNYQPLFCGIDPARAKDATSVTVFERYDNLTPKGSWDRYDYKCVCSFRILNQDIPTQYSRIRPILQNKSMSGIAIDMGAIGRAMSDSVVSDFPHAIPVAFTAPKKAQMAERLVGLIAYEKISLPDDPAARDDILCVRREVGPSGGVSYDGRSKYGHGDVFWSCALAMEAAEQGIDRTILL